MRPIYARFVEGRCPYFDILPLQGAIPFKPESWGETQGISAQGIVNGVNDTLGPPMSRVLKVSRPVRAERRDRGNAPSTHTGGLSEDGMRWWNDEHMGITHPRPTRADYREMVCVGGAMSTWGLRTQFTFI